MSPVVQAQLVQSLADFIGLIDDDSATRFTSFVIWSPPGETDGLLLVGKTCEAVPSATIFLAYAAQRAGIHGDFLKLPGVPHLPQLERRKRYGSLCSIFVLYLKALW